MDNQHLYGLDTEQIQVLLTATFGDGGIYTVTGGVASKGYFAGSSVTKELLEYKIKLLKSGYIKEPNGFNKANPLAKNLLYTIQGTGSSEAVRQVHSLSIKEKLDLMTKLGIALWFYDDGSLHKTKYFYNLNTQIFPKEVQEGYFIPFFNKLGIYPKVTVENKKDGRVYHYLSIGRHDGAVIISRILRKYYLASMEYKMWSSQTIQIWSKLEAELKSEGKVLTARAFTNRFNEMLFRETHCKI